MITHDDRTKSTFTKWRIGKNRWELNDSGWVCVKNQVTWFKSPNCFWPRFFDWLNFISFLPCFLKPASLWTYELGLGGFLVLSRLFLLSKNNFLIASPIMSLSDSCFSLRFHLPLFCISQCTHTSIYTPNNLNHHEMMCLVSRLLLDPFSDYYWFIVDSITKCSLTRCCDFSWILDIFNIFIRVGWFYFLLFTNITLYSFYWILIPFVAFGLLLILIQAEIAVKGIFLWILGRKWCVKYSSLKQLCL